MTAQKNGNRTGQLGWKLLFYGRSAKAEREHGGGAGRQRHRQAGPDHHPVTLAGALVVRDRRPGYDHTEAEAEHEDKDHVPTRGSPGPGRLVSRPPRSLEQRARWSIASATIGSNRPSS